MRALWKYYELVVTNQGAHISLNTFINSLKKSHFFEEVLFYLKKEVMAFLNINIKMRLRACSYEPGWPGWPAYWDEFRLEFIWENSAQFPRWETAEDPRDEFWREIRETNKDGET